MIAPDIPPTPDAEPTLLTFCIPTYNRSASVHQLVTTILSRPDRDIEVVVLDNGSTDDTLEVLGRIADRRLKVRSNGQNRGALFNMVNVFSHGNGKYLVYSTDQDQTDAAMIPDFKDFLASHPEVSCGYCTFDAPDGKSNEIFAKGFDCVNAIAYKGRHPTGYFFKNTDLKNIHLVERFSDFEVVDLFPLEFAFGEVGLMGAGAIYHRPLFSPNTGSEVVTHKSATTNGKSKTAFFAPAARLKLAISYSRHIEQLAIPTSEKSMLTAQVFMTELRAATVGFRAVMRNDELCVHYRMQPRNVSPLELTGIAASFCANYFNRQFSRRMAKVIPFATGMFKVAGRKIRARVA